MTRTWTATTLDVPGPIALEAELVMPSGSQAAAVVLCHGLPSGSEPDPSDPGYPGLARRLAEDGLAAARFSFRGCYGSQGDLSLGGWVEDLRAVVAEVLLRTRLPVIVVGSSLGGAVALIGSAPDDNVAAIATLAAPADFLSLVTADDGTAFLQRIRDMGLFRTPGFPQDPEAWGREFLTSRPEDAASILGPRPLLVVHGAQDDVVPVDHARRIADAAAGPVTKVVLPGASHQLRRDEQAVGVLREWLSATAATLS